MRTLPKCPIKLESTMKVTAMNIDGRKMYTYTDKTGVLRPIPKLY